MARSLELDQKSRSELVEDARRLGVDRPERMTRVELVDEIVRRTTPLAEQAEARGLFGVARSMLASVIESGLNLPEAASVIRGQVTARVPAGNQAPVATVTLAEIYAAQGHRTRALRMIEEVLSAEPDHQEALRVQRALLAGADMTRADAAPTKGASAPLQAERVTELTRPGHETFATSDYIPAGFVETIGEEVETGKPPQVILHPEPAPAPREAEKADLSGAVPAESTAVPAESTAVPAESTAVLAESTAVPAESTAVPAESEPGSAVDPEEASGVMEKPSGTEHELVIDGEPVVDRALEAPALVIHSTAHGVYLYWELPGSVLEQCGVDRSDGQACLRLVVITPSGSKPQRAEHTFFLNEGERLSASRGTLQLDPIAEGSTVRAALGWLSVDAFLPICVGRPWERMLGEDGQRTLMERAQPHLGL